MHYINTTYYTTTIIKTLHLFIKKRRNTVNSRIVGFLHENEQN